VEHGLTLLRVKAVEKLICSGLSNVHTQYAPLLLIATLSIVVGGMSALTYRRSATPLR
jgi:hypothetical protein